MLFASVVLLSSGVVLQLEKLFCLGSVLLLASLLLVGINALYAFKYKIKE